jgi:hypothetical protein
MPRYLLIANQTLGGRALDDEIRARVADGAAEFHVVVPMVEPEFEAQEWVPADPLFGIPAATAHNAEMLDEAERRSQHRLDRILDRIQELGGAADGEVGARDPFDAARAALERVEADGVIISTLPSGISRWLKLDLPSRVARVTDLPVTTVEAEPSTVS